MEYVAAHLSKIHGLDWHPDNEYILATSSQDNSVRVIRITINDHIVHILLFCWRLTYMWFCVCIDLLQKFWDYRQPRKYLDILSCQVPVWKARYTVQFYLKCCCIFYWCCDSYTTGQKFGIICIFLMFLKDTFIKVHLSCIYLIKNIE